MRGNIKIKNPNNYKIIGRGILINLNSILQKSLYN